MLIDLSRNKPTVGFHCHSVTSFHHLSIMAARGHYEYGKKAEDFVRRFEEIIHLFEDRLLSEVRNQLTLTRPECEELMEVTDPGEVMHLAEDIRQVFKDDLLTEMYEHAFPGQGNGEAMDVAGISLCKAKNKVGTVPFSVLIKMVVKLDPLRPLEGTRK
ncbi:uncharacterized protein LOC111342736 isoform X3 [Stylophora pistillata]|uniref:uncharacterized protein LOC111342736 isoform X3 n=1 Tax=Stylophora pistillata TaxID=50429 RepID=UPI000C04B251|nr:uncharacterized protein LOC111342736 isoform X3 [Stylophora pistillata]